MKLILINILFSDFIKILSEKYLKTFQPFDLSQVPSISAECREHAQMFYESLTNFEFWALKCKF